MKNIYYRLLVIFSVSLYAAVLYTEIFIMPEPSMGILLITIGAIATLMGVATYIKDRQTAKQ